MKLNPRGLEATARAICWANDMNPDLKLGGDGENFLWHEYEHEAEAAITAYLATAPSDGKAATAEPGEGEDDWRDDPSADDRWNAGCGYAQEQLCKVLGVDPQSIDWDAATETLDGDVQSVTCKILTAGLGEEWAEHTAPPSAQPSGELVERLRAAADSEDYFQEESDALLREAATALSQPPETDAVAAEREDWSEEFAKHRGWSLIFDGKTFCEDDNTELWCVHEVRGNRNDREWNVIGLGATPAIAVSMAYRTERARTDAATGGEKP